MDIRPKLYKLKELLLKQKKALLDADVDKALSLQDEMGRCFEDIQKIDIRDVKNSCSEENFSSETKRIIQELLLCYDENKKLTKKLSKNILAKQISINTIKKGILLNLRCNYRNGINLST